MKKLLVISILFLLTTASFASTRGQYGGMLHSLWVKSIAPNSARVLIRVDNNVANIINRPECATNQTYGFAFDAKTPAGMVTLTMLMSSHGENDVIRLVGNGTCDLYPGVEDLFSISPVYNN